MFDVTKVNFMKVVAIPLCPELARVGLEIRVVGNDAGEKVRQTIEEEKDFNKIANKKNSNPTFLYFYLVEHLGWDISQIGLILCLQNTSKNSSDSDSDSNFLSLSSNNLGSQGSKLWTWQIQ